uniref:Histone H2A C-terminal domain-containing protein n=1 Tax=Solanum lycopersicum TaxID=4081 RepID=A0A3Q7GHB4_SOLLC
MWVRNQCSSREKFVFQFPVVLEYLCLLVIELIGIELSQFLRDVTILNDGVIPNIHNIFLSNKKNSDDYTLGEFEERINGLIPNQ